jgi:hypothetical protein
MESWRKVWRDGLAPSLPTKGLQALARALQFDDERLIQEAATSPRWQPSFPRARVMAACAVAFCGWQGAGLGRVDEIEEFVGSVCFEADQRLGEPSASRRFLNWFDATPRDQMRRLLLGEVQAILAERVPVKRVYARPSAVKAA